MGSLRRIALPVLVFVLSLLLPASAAALRSHSLDPAAADFWTAARVQRALTSDAMDHRPVPAAATAGASSLRVIDASDPVDRVNGRIFGIDPERGAYSCSGISLATASESIVLTAGHCVLEAGRWGTHLVFVPAYDHESRPFGTFAATAVYVMPGWRATGNSDFDVAALRVRPSALGTLGARVGARGWASSRSRFSAFQIFGYPAAALGGEELRSCANRGLGSDRLLNRNPGPSTVPVKCDMAGGSSGGAWLIDGAQLVDGVTSYGYDGKPGRLFSPYFGPEVDSFLRRLP
jgi:V8-like Glu-specific endopeptidase